MFWVWRCYGLLWTLHCHKDWYCDVIMMWPLLFHGIRADVSETPGNALTTRMHCDYRPSIDRFFVGFNAICYAFLRNNPIYIEGRNCSFTTVPVLFNNDLPKNGLPSRAWRRQPSHQLDKVSFGPRTPYRVGGLAGDVMRARVSHSSVNHWIYDFKASLLSC